MSRSEFYTQVQDDKVSIFCKNVDDEGVVKHTYIDERDTRDEADELVKKLCELPR